MRKTSVTVKQDESAPIAVEILADAIVRVSDGFEKAMRQGLTRQALVILVQAAVGKSGSQFIMTQADIHRVFNALPELKKLYTTKK